MDKAELARLRAIATQAGAERRMLNESAPKSVKKKRQLNTVQSVAVNALPLIGSGVGAVVGSVVPGFGTAIGGAAGGSGGEYLRQKILNEDTNLARIGVEGALGSLAGAGQALKAGKAAVIGSKAARAAKVADTAVDTGKVLKTAATASKATKAGKVIQTARKGKTLSQAEKAAQAVTTTGDDVARGAVGAVDDAAKPGLLRRGSRSLQADASGLKLQKSPGAVGELGKQADFMAQFKGTPRKQLAQMDKTMRQLGSQVDTTLKTSKVKMDGLDVAKKMINIDPADTRFIDLDLSPAAMKTVSRYANKTKNFTDASSINNLLKSINPAASKAEAILRNPAGKTLTAQQNAILAVKRNLDDALSAIPEIKPLKQQMAKIYEVYPDVVAASKKTLGVPLLGIKSNRLAQAAKGAESYGASFLNNLTGSVGTNAAGQSFKRQVAGATGKQALNRMYASVIAGTPIGGFTDGAYFQDEQPTESGQTFDPEVQTVLDDISNQYGGMQTANMTQGEPEITATSFFSDPDKIERAYTEALMNGDNATAKLLLDGMNAFSKVREAKAKATGSAGGTEGLNVTKPTAQNYSNALSGMQSLQQLRDTLASDPGVVGRSVVPGRSLPMIGGYIANQAGTGKFDAYGYNIADKLLRISTGATANESEIRKLQSQIMPRAGDSPETIQVKLDQIEQILQNIVTLGNPGQTSGGIELPEEALLGV